MGRVEAICVSARKGEKKSPQQSARVVAEHGIEGDAHAGPWHRQVSLLAAEDIEAMRQRGLPGLKSGDFAENLVVSGVDLGALGLGSRLRLGSEIELTVTQLGKTCHQRCAIYYQTGDCIMPRLGLFARVVRGGTLVTGDVVEVPQVVPRQKPQGVILNTGCHGSPDQTAGTSTSAVAQVLKDSLHAHIYASETLPNDRYRLSERLRHYSDGHSIDFVVVVGGADLVQRDLTPNAETVAMQRLGPDLLEVMRPAAPDVMLISVPSGKMPVKRNGTLMIGLPAMENGVVEFLQACLPALKRHLAQGRSAA